MTDHRSPWTDVLGLDLPAFDGVDPEAVSYIADEIAVAVTGTGSVGDDDADDLAEAFEDECDDADQAITIVTTMVASATAAHAALAATWEGETDNDRLDAAFADLEERCIVARHDLGMTLSDGEYDIDEIVDARLAEGQTVRGNAFYHRQDLARAIVGEGLNLAFTGDRTGPVAARAIGLEIKSVLESHGLAVDWNGDADARMTVAMDWKRRPDAVA